MCLCHKHRVRECECISVSVWQKHEKRGRQEKKKKDETAVPPLPNIIQLLSLDSVHWLLERCCWLITYSNYWF